MVGSADHAFKWLLLMSRTLHGSESPTESEVDTEADVIESAEPAVSADMLEEASAAF